MENKAMNNATFKIVESGQSPTLSDAQKNAIAAAILQAVANGNYHDGLEKKACQAISNINRFSDGELITEAVDLQTGCRYRKVV